MERAHHYINYFVRLVPLTIMGLLTLFSFVIVKQGNRDAQASSLITPHQSDHDYYLHSFSVRQFDPFGKVKSSFTGTTGLHFETAQRLDIQQFSFVFTNDSTQYSGVSNSALIADDGNDAKLYKEVKIERADVTMRAFVTRFESQYFHFTQFPDAADTNLPVQIHRDKDVISADSLRYDSDERRLVLTGHVKIRVAPKN